MNDQIEIRRLEICTHIGVPDEERATAQKLWVSVWMTPSQGLRHLQDNIANTIDYHAVSLEITDLAAAKPRKLIEALAEDIANHLLRSQPLKCLSVKIEKRILPNTDFVAVKIHRSA